MNLDRYAQTQQVLYAELAATVKLILEKSIAAMGAPQPQSIQCRAKSADSLRPKLEARELLHSDSIEKEIKDLAGVRLIFYTNTDVNRFLSTSLISDSFEVDWNETRIHHPTSENTRQRYQAIHYTVCLSAQRLALPEYAKFKGMRCEIQIQTILNHAWAETSHDILYKKPGVSGFGTRAFDAIENRMKRVMDDYLLPAGYELQKVQHDFSRLMEGQLLFDRGALETLAQCDNNNDRHDTLSRIKEYFLPNYDDIPGIYTELCTALVDAVEAARASLPKPIESTFGSLPGKASEDVVALAINILDDWRYIDVERTFYTLTQIYRGEPHGDIRKRVLETAKRLAAYNINVWQRVGPHVQYALAEILAGMAADERFALRPLVVAVWSVLLKPEMRGTSAPAFDQIVLSVGPVPASDALSAIRDRAITGLLELWDQSSSQEQYREVFSALSEAMRMPSQGGTSSDLCTIVLKDARRVVDSLAGRLSDKPYELIQHVEHQFLWKYRNVRGFAEDPQGRFACREVAMHLRQAILAVRDRLNADEQYIRYKTLVGFEVVLSPSWENDDFDKDGADQYRHDRATEYIKHINDRTEDEWYRFLLRCAETESQDGATFRVFGEFLVELAKVKPETAIRFIRKDDSRLMMFRPAFLNGLSQSAAHAGYRALLAGYVAEGRHLSAIAQHYRTTKTASPEQIIEVLDKALAAGDDIAVIKCLALTFGQAVSPGYSLIEHVFVPAIKHLTARRDARWVNCVWFMGEAKGFVDTLSAAQVNLVLENLLLLSKIDHRAERLLAFIAEGHPQAVWQFFGHRLERQQHGEGERYEAFPYEFGELEQPLGQDPDAAVASVRNWFRPGDARFRFNGARLLSAAFPGFPKPFAAKLLDLAENGYDADLSLILDVMQNYHRESSTHPVLQAVVNRLPEDDPRLREVKIAMRNTGVVSGEFGMVDAFRKKKENADAWLCDPRPKVVAFAQEFIREIDGNIAQKQREAEQILELRRRNFEANG